MGSASENSLRMATIGYRDLVNLARTSLSGRFRTEEIGRVNNMLDNELSGGKTVEFVLGV